MYDLETISIFSKWEMHQNVKMWLFIVAAVVMIALFYLLTPLLRMKSRNNEYAAMTP